MENDWKQQTRYLNFGNLTLESVILLMMLYTASNRTAQPRICSSFLHSSVFYILQSPRRGEMVICLI